jgi:hypothetical protein
VGWQHQVVQDLTKMRVALMARPVGSSQGEVKPGQLVDFGVVLGRRH